MKKFLITTSLIAFLSTPALAKFDHSSVITGNFTSGPEVTAQCLQCHEKAAKDFMATSHWKWKGVPYHIGKFQNPANAKKEWGKINMFNNFCVNPMGGNFEYCARCHAGYAKEYSQLEAQGPKLIDCLVCHTKERDYFKNKKPGGVVEPAILNKAAKNIGKPERFNCGWCHFAGGGGDNVKHGGLYSKMGGKIPAEVDVHMGKLDMQCQDCHVTKDHKIAGASSMLATFTSRVACTDCHSGKVHEKAKAGKLLDRHTKSVACETCHIPAIARGGIATKLHWDWSYVGKDEKEFEGKEEYGREVFAKHKGLFKWGVNIVPVYAWYNGKMERYMMGDKIQDPSKPVYLSKPMGSIRDPNAKIYPFKVHTGKQPYDTQYKHLLVFRVWKALWSDYNWEKALTLGSKESGLPYSGKYDFINTIYYIAAKHEVAPKDKALSCNDCHFNQRMDWKALGYPDDPALVGGRFTKGLVKEKSAKK